MMSFGEAISTCFKKYVTFSGRARRPEYWWFYLFVIIVSVVLSIIDAILFPPSVSSDPLEAAAAPAPLSTIWSLATLLPSLAVTWRRLHDIGRPGYHVFMPLLPLIPAGVLFFLALQNPSGGDGLLYGAIGFFVLTLIAQIVVIVWLASRSQSGENRFGPEPGAAVNVDGVFE